MADVLTLLANLIDDRKNADPQTSYVASLHHKGLNKILEKVGEECIETVIAAKDAVHSGQADEVLYETADLWFHSLVMLSALNLRPEAVLAELARRQGLSGLAEKAARPTN